MRNKLTYQEKFKGAIHKIIAEEYNEAVGKSQLTKIVGAWQKEGDSNSIKRAIQEILVSVLLPKYAAWIYERYLYVAGYYFESGRNVLGWYSESQIQAEVLPLELHYQRQDKDRECRVLACGPVWENRGFFAAQALPYQWLDYCAFTYSDNPRYWSKRGYAPGDVLPIVFIELVVHVPAKDFATFAALGYASPCEIQWNRKKHPFNELESGLYVERSIIPHGFWCAWKWWDGARDWYYKNRPELFEDCEIWGPEPVRHVPPEPYAAVLGGSEEYQARVRKFGFVLDDE